MQLLHYLTILWIVQINVGLGLNNILSNTIINSSPRKDLPFPELAYYDGIEKVEIHYVTTKDGYILTLYRIPPRKNCTSNKGPLVFGHGLFLSSDDCLIPGPGKGHCHIYHEEGFDVWALNNRGNCYSRNHTTYDPDKDAKYWDFTLHEMGKFDLPAIIDYILCATNATQVTYVAHSQGFANLLICCATFPEYNVKIKIAYGLSVTTWLTHSTFIGIELQAIVALTGAKLDVEVLCRGGLTQRAVELLCCLSKFQYPICSYLIFAAFGYNKYQITCDVLPVAVAHTPCGTSLKNFEEWGIIKNCGFPYNLSNVTVKVVLIDAVNDNVANITDVKYLASQLSDVTLCVLPDLYYGHLDFIWGKDIANYIAPIVLSGKCPYCT